MQRITSANRDLPQRQSRVQGIELPMLHPSAPCTLEDRKLTVREKEIMAYVLQGKTSWEIGHIYGIQETTVRQYMKNIYGVLRVNNKISAVIAYLCYEMVLEHHARSPSNNAAK